MESRQQKVEATLRLSPVVAIVVIDERTHAVPMARALVAGGVRAIEVTLRTAAALDAIRAIANEVEGAVVGAGTLLKPADFVAAERAGATFAVSPGATPGLLDAAADTDLPYLPGAATAGEMMTLLERGYRFQKFFPASYAGGVDLLKALASPLPGIVFCPTGGITAASAPAWLSLPNVVCVGGSWLVAPKLLHAADWRTVGQLAREAAALRG
ncbi:MAG TPA: bifunctional 4-hydroxy-2-oxoglutarate aldolase/2-dehydro-3-deoxy-phosphogluconate aldolase [Rudaea sp.]